MRTYLPLILLIVGLAVAADGFKLFQSEAGESEAAVVKQYHSNGVVTKVSSGVREPRKWSWKRKGRKEYKKPVGFQSFLSG